MEAFGGKALGDLAGTFASFTYAIGDRLGLFKDLATRGPATSAELAGRAGITERYAREWRGGLLDPADALAGNTALLDRARAFAAARVAQPPREELLAVITVAASESAA